MEERTVRSITAFGILQLLLLFGLYSILNDVKSFTKNIENYVDGIHTDVRFIADKFEKRS